MCTSCTPPSDIDRDLLVKARSRLVDRFVVSHVAIALVDPSRPLKVVQGEITSITESPLWEIAVFWAPAASVTREGPRYKVAPQDRASEQQSNGGKSLMTPVFNFDPRPAVAENCPLVKPYTPLFSMT